MLDERALQGSILMRELALLMFWWQHANEPETIVVNRNRSRRFPDVCAPLGRTRARLNHPAFYGCRRGGR
jgi:hypothetical protein